MFDSVPVRAWLYIGLAAAAYAPTRYVIRYLQAAHKQRDLFQPPSDTSWRSPALLARSVAALVLFVTLAAFMATPAAERFAKSPSFWPILMVAMGFWALWTVLQGYLSGAIEPMTRGASWTFHRDAQPKRFWASMAWNGLLGGSLLFISYQLIQDGPKQALRDQCDNRDNTFSPKEILAACNSLLDDPSDGRRSNWLAARGTAYYLMMDYERALADYRAAVSLDPQDSSSYFNIGLVYEQQREWRSAADAYAAAIKADPKNADASARRWALLRE